MIPGLTKEEGREDMLVDFQEIMAILKKMKRQQDLAFAWLPEQEQSPSVQVRPGAGMEEAK